MIRSLKLLFGRIRLQIRQPKSPKTKKGNCPLCANKVLLNMSEDASGRCVGLSRNFGKNSHLECPPEPTLNFLLLGPMTAGEGFLKTFLGIVFAILQSVVKALLWPIYGGRGQKVPPVTDLILLDSAVTLAHKIRTKKVKSVEVVQSYIDRIRVVNPILNCVVDERFAEALKEARKVDELISSGEKTAEELERETPFLGVPFTAKDSIAMKGMSFTAGIIRRKATKAQEDAEVVEYMKKAGAIPLAITNVAEMCMWWESNNPVYGRTKNYYNTNRIVGGSSGGEGCLLSSGGSAMGLGSDIGGSLRMPAFFNGVFTHKATTGTVSLQGHHPMPSNSDQISFLLIGPMARYSEDLIPMFKVISPGSETKLRLNDPVDLAKIKYYYMDDDTGGIFVSPVEREIKMSVHRVVQYFKKNHKITVQKVNLTKLRYSMALWFARMVSPHGPQVPMELVNREGRVNITLELLKFLFGLSQHTLAVLVIALMESLNADFGSPKHKFLVETSAQLLKEFEELLGEDGVFLYPTHPTAAPYHNEPIFKALNVGYTAVFNILGLPVTHCPMGLNSDGLPIGIQIVGNKNQDRLTLAVASELEKAFGGWVPSPAYD